jgi:hypothetical protein
MSAPERIFVRAKPNGALGRRHDATSDAEIAAITGNSTNPMFAYILATPEALAASPEVQALIAAAETRGWNAAIEAAAKLLGKYVDGLIEEYGNHEWDTNVTNLPEWVVTIEEEFETQSAAIRALKKGE